MDGLPAFLLGSFPSEIRLNTVIKAVSHPVTMHVTVNCKNVFKWSCYC